MWVSGNELFSRKWINHLNWSKWCYFCIATTKKPFKVSLINDYTKNLYDIEEISVKNLNYIKENMAKNFVPDGTFANFDFE
jgi:hypothetical protein